MQRPENASPSPLLLTNIGQLISLRGHSGPLRGKELTDLGIVEDAAVLCFEGRIALAGKKDEVCRSEVIRYFERALTEVDCRYGVVMPGFVDSHTHPVFMEPRLLDFEKRIAGATYQQIAEAGGGIHSSVMAVRSANLEKLSHAVSLHLDSMLHYGTTTVEAKSGYGLSLESEIKSLRAIKASAQSFRGTVIATLLAAHVVPVEYRDQPEDYVRLVCEEMVPQAAKQQLAEFVDVFCEHGAFTLAQTEKIFAAAEQHALGRRAHVCQFMPTELPKLMPYAPSSCDHLDHVSQRDIATLANSPTVATLLPGSNYFLGQGKYPDARKLIDSGVAVALATDFNPGTSPTPSMPFVLSLACTHMKMSPAEVISAATINAAHALRLAKQKGSIEEGKDADLAAFAVRDYRELAYWFGVNPCSHVVARGNLVSH